MKITVESLEKLSAGAPPPPPLKAVPSMQPYFDQTTRKKEREKERKKGKLELCQAQIKVGLPAEAELILR